jgi:hypothetical protein
VRECDNERQAALEQQARHDPEAELDDVLAGRLREPPDLGDDVAEGIEILAGALSGVRVSEAAPSA